MVDIDNQLTSVIDYLQCDKKLNEENLKAIQDLYQQLLSNLEDRPNFAEPDTSVITEVAKQLHLNIDIDDSLDLLKECVRYQDVNNAIMMVKYRIAGPVSPLEESLLSIPSFSLPSKSLPELPLTTDSLERLVDVKCLFHIKMRTTDVDTFIRSFLLKTVEELNDPPTDINNSDSVIIRHNEQFILSRGCLFDLFIRKQINSRGIIRSVSHHNSDSLRLSEPISSIDDFSAWQYDRWYGIFDFSLVPYDNCNKFPPCWNLADDVRIHCQFIIEGSGAKSSNSSRIDQPRTTSLDAFVHDVCARENNGKGDDWLKALHDEDILTFEHLTNLCESEWKYIRKLTMHAKKTLKTAIDRDRTNIASERRQVVVKTVDKATGNSSNVITENTSYSQSQMLANLHLIKLFIWDTLREEPAVQNHGALSKLDPECLKKAFVEMRNEGFADDGLFPKIEEFFLPLTISERELCLERRLNSSMHQALVTQQNQLKNDLAQSEKEYEKQKANLSIYDEKIDLLKKQFEERQLYYKEKQNATTSIHETQEEFQSTELPVNVDQSEDTLIQRNHEQQSAIQKKSNWFYPSWLQALYTYLMILTITISQRFFKNQFSFVSFPAVSTPDSKSASQQQENMMELQRLNQQWQEELLDMNKKADDIKKLKEKTNKQIIDLENQIDKLRASLKICERKMEKPHQNIDKRLVKPARGLIMYGPPGTGKSEIMSKLAAKLGIVMVGPPLAAGELNRPLVGESERILIALCSRCHRLPYAMCCVSIDEIDSLAPKRSEDSSEGKIDKISVLLSLIDGIKDVPNFMILCATNRLHMMDEAFLRRMSGKFFVGRPSSDARTKILSTIPDWAIESETIDRLSITTTNFSGAAVRALTQAITVKCMTAQRVQPTHSISYAEGLRIADRIARQYQIFIGSETLPRILLRNKLDHVRHQLSPNVNYTGRIVIDLHNGFIQMEIFLSQAVNEKKTLAIIERKLDENETNIQTLLDRLTVYGKNRNVQLLQLVDLNLLASQGAYDEKKVFETLKDRYDECVAYARSMIVYDLDALVGVNKSESNSNMGVSTSSSVVNQNIYTYIRARFRDCAIEDSQEQENIDNIERWAVAVIREPFLVRQFCTDVQFASSVREEEERKRERQKAEDLLKCVKCKDFYIETENKMGNCVHHDGFVYDNMASNLCIYTQSEVTMLLNQLECDICLNCDDREKLELQRNKFKWICCDATFTSGNVGGCKKGKHGLNVTNTQQLSRQQSINGQVDRLDQVAIELWETICRENIEYSTKWLTYCKKRAAHEKSKIIYHPIQRRPHVDMHQNLF